MSYKDVLGTGYTRISRIYLNQQFIKRYNNNQQLAAVMHSQKGSPCSKRDSFHDASFVAIATSYYRVGIKTTLSFRTN